MVPTLQTRRRACKITLAAALFLCVFNAGESRASDAQIVLALRAMNKDKWSEARPLVTQAKDPLATKLYRWMYFTKQDAPDDFDAMAQFVLNNPDWPGIAGIQAKAERAMPYKVSASEVTGWFDEFPPQTATGLDRYMDALIVSGRSADARKYLSEWWAKMLMTRDEQKHIYKKYSAYITMDAHRRRLDTLLFMKQYTNARALAPILGPGYPELAEARIALAGEQGGVPALLAKVPAKLQRDPGLLYERLHFRRERDLDRDAIAILNQQPPADQIQNPKDWWKERHIMIRRLLEDKQYEPAYRLAKNHGLKEGAEMADAEWLAGWLALRFLHSPAKGFAHFEKLFKQVSTPVSKARAAYWSGRAAKEHGKTDIAKLWFQEAAKYQTVFYGQMAGAELGLALALPNAAPPKLSEGDLSALRRNELIRAAKLFNEAGMKKESGRFLEAFVDKEHTPKAYRFAAEMAAGMKQYYIAVKIAKDATSKGMFLTAQSYPVITERLRRAPVEWALAHSIIRQESMFDPEAQSPVGALGMMQLMPATAKVVAGREGVGYSRDRLTNPDYNIRLGSAYLAELLERFDGSYPMAAAAYNAGPGRVAEWIDMFGDPRTGEIDLIDWIELIPISETRNYVQRVMESVYVYRLRLKGVQQPPSTPIHIAEAGRH